LLEATLAGSTVFISSLLAEKYNISGSPAVLYRKEVGSQRKLSYGSLIFPFKLPLLILRTFFGVNTDDE
jgi:hypothetical protein